MSDVAFPDDLPADEMGDYLRLYLDETGDQLDGLVQTLLALEADPSSARHLNEAFRLIHSIKGSSALLGLDRITTLTHHLESHFERLRSGRRTLDAETMNVVLRCIDFLRACNDHLRRGEPLGTAGDLLDQVKGLEQSTQPVPAPLAPRPATGNVVSLHPVELPAHGSSLPRWQIEVHFQPGLPLAEMRAELILTRLTAIGTVLGSNPPAELLADTSNLSCIEIELDTAADRPALQAALSVDGVERVVLGISGTASHSDAPQPRNGEGDAGVLLAEPVAAAAGAQAGDATAQAGDSAGPLITETVRVDVERLDVLLNLTGELVVSRARFVQLLGVLAPMFRKTGLAGRSAQIADALRGMLHALESATEVDTRSVSRSLAEQLHRLDDQGSEWDDCRRTFAELVATVDQLTRVSQSLQHGVLGTRMVPVGPLLTRFKRSVRDVAQELGKRVQLEIVGEKTELDKRMIDELGDPLNHLIRNAIDHGIEPGDVRIRRGKPEVATIRLSASHRGNSVFITVADDGDGIDLARVRQIAVTRGLITPEAAGVLGEAETIELIWQPGFSTAAKVSDISGRGVGMDIVRTKIRTLNGTVEVNSVGGIGTTFTIRLPLTLTITRCMLFRLPQAVFAAPIENVREIVRLADHQVVAANGRQVFDVRGEFMPLVGIDDLFAWPGATGGPGAGDNVVILQAGAQSVGLRVDTPLGGQDLVVKPLDEHYTHIQGLGGASILGDGSVCLLLDVATCIGIALSPPGRRNAADADVTLVTP
jgi:two-component system chemotaxis sensor kinase CheA